MRVDLTGDVTEEKYVEWVRQYADETSLLVVREDPRGDNPHMHAMFKSSSTVAAIRKQLQRVFEVRAKKWYSLTEQQGNAKYLCKGPLAISKLKDPKYPGEKRDPKVLYRGETYSESDIQKLHEEWWEEAKSFRVEKFKKRAEMSELDNIIEFVENKWLGIDKKLKPEFTESDLEACVVDYYVTNRKMIRYSMMVEYVDTVWLILLNTYERKQEYREYRCKVMEQLRAYRFKKFY